MGATPPIKFNCLPGASPAEWRVIPGCEDVGKVRLLPREGSRSSVWFGGSEVVAGAAEAPPQIVGAEQQNLSLVCDKGCL